MARILVVEDDVYVLPLVDRVISEAGEDELVAVKSAKNAIFLLRTQPLDLVIADAKLADGSGLEIADVARDVDVQALIISSGDVPAVSLAKYDYLLKPVRSSQLREAIVALVGVPLRGVWRARGAFG